MRRGGREGGGESGTTSFEETSCSRRGPDKSCQSRLKKGRRLSDDKRSQFMLTKQRYRNIRTWYFQNYYGNSTALNKLMTCREERVREEAEDVDEGGGRLGKGGGRDVRGAEEKGTSSSSVSSSSSSLLISGSSLLSNSLLLATELPPSFSSFPPLLPSASWQPGLSPSSKCLRRLTVELHLGRG